MSIRLFMDITLKYRPSEISTADALAVGGLPVNWQCASAFTGKSRAQELVKRAPNGFSIQRAFVLASLERGAGWDLPAADSVRRAL
jgi:hypothetical protein